MSGWNRDFYDIHATDIILHRSAKKYFDELGMKKLPLINQLKQEYATTLQNGKRSTLTNTNSKIYRVSFPSPAQTRSVYSASRRKNKTAKLYVPETNITLTICRPRSGRSIRAADTDLTDGQAPIRGGF
jgi:hypothetical protein